MLMEDKMEAIISLDTDDDCYIVLPGDDINDEDSWRTCLVIKVTSNDSSIFKLICNTLLNISVVAKSDTEQSNRYANDMREILSELKRSALDYQEMAQFGGNINGQFELMRYDLEVTGE